MILDKFVWTYEMEPKIYSKISILIISKIDVK